MLQAKVKEDYKFPTVRAFTGREYVKDYWRDVPLGVDDEAKRHPYLEIREMETEVEAETAPDPEAEPKPVSRKDLLERAKELNLKKYSKLNKSDLADLIAEREAEL